MKKLSILVLASTMGLVACKKDEPTPEQTPTPTPSVTSVTDANGNQYSTKVIGSQEWMTENLRVTVYSNGDTIPNVTDNLEWSNSTTGAWSYMYNQTNLDTVYGKLYNWYTVADTRNVCPTGWHVPTYDEWTVLADHLGGASIAGGKMKSTGTQDWLSPNLNATNESGFSALPGGERKGYNGEFVNVGLHGLWWSTDQDINITGWGTRLKYDQENLVMTGNLKEDGMSIRCVKD